MNLKVVPTCGTREEHLALLVAIVHMTPEGPRADKLYSVLVRCIAELLDDLTPEDLHWILGAYDVEKPPKKKRQR